MQYRQETIICLHGFPANGANPALAQQIDLVASPCRQMQEPHQNLILMHKLQVFDCGAGDFDDDMTARKGFFVVIDDAPTRHLVALIFKTGADAGVMFNINAMAGLCERLDAGWRKRRPIFMRPLFAGNRNVNCCHRASEMEMLVV